MTIAPPSTGEEVTANNTQVHNVDVDVEKLCSNCLDFMF